MTEDPLVFVILNNVHCILGAYGKHFMVALYAIH